MERLGPIVQTCIPLDFQLLNYLRSEVVDRFVDISGIVDHHCLNFLFMKCNIY